MVGSTEPEVNSETKYPIMTALLKRCGGSIPLKKAAKLALAAHRYPTDLDDCYPGILREIQEILQEDLPIPLRLYISG